MESISILFLFFTCIITRLKEILYRKWIKFKVFCSSCRNALHGSLPATSVSPTAVTSMVFGACSINNLVAASSVAGHKLLQSDYCAQNQGYLGREQGGSSDKGDLTVGQLRHHGWKKEKKLENQKEDIDKMSLFTINSCPTSHSHCAHYQCTVSLVLFLSTCETERRQGIFNFI